MLFPAQSWLNEAINHMSKTCQASARTEVGSESDENRIVEQWAFYSLSLPWQVTTKGSVLSPLLMVQWHIFYCSSFVWPSSSSFQWAASPWAAAKIYIFPANDVSPMVQDDFHTWWSSSVDGATLSHCAANGAGREASFFLLSVDRQALHIPVLPRLRSQERFVFPLYFIKIM